MSDSIWTLPRWQELTGIRHNPLDRSQPMDDKHCSCDRNPAPLCEIPNLPFDLKSAVEYWKETEEELGLFGEFTDYEGCDRIGKDWVGLGSWATKFRYGKYDLETEMQFWLEMFYTGLDLEAERDSKLLVS